MRKLIYPFVLALFFLAGIGQANANTCKQASQELKTAELKLVSLNNNLARLDAEADRLNRLHSSALRKEINYGDKVYEPAATKYRRFKIQSLNSNNLAIQLELDRLKREADRKQKVWFAYRARTKSYQRQLDSVAKRTMATMNSIVKQQNIIFQKEEAEDRLCS